MLRQVRQFETNVYCPSEFRESKGAEAQPELQCLERARELHAAFVEVHVLRDVARHVREVVGVVFLFNAECVAQHAGIFHEQTAKLVRLEQPLVRIECDGIGASQAGKCCAAAFGDNGSRAVCAVDMQPQSFALAQVRECIKRVHGAGVGGAAVGHYAERQSPSRAIVRNRNLERGNGKAKGIVRGNGAALLRAKPDNAQSLCHGRMRLVGTIDDGTLVRSAKLCVARGGDGGQVGH